ncbi:oligopeptide:H+ symporter [Amycolatopsis sp. NPDC021455]|uniref:peptide MFS transporter n=1 Tax=Amycolatopsis sp. NPDC021455 TaxID=3154901 RepID=UPI0033F19E4D
MTATLRGPTQVAALRHSPWFRALFLTDMWERFGFYGMQAVFVLYAVEPVAGGGLGLPPSSAAALFGVYIGLTFLFALPGGWLADRVLGLRRSILAGSVMIAAGYLVLAVPARAATPVGLLLVMAGGGLFKPNLQALVNLLSGKDSARRETAISMLFVGVQFSALAAPLLTAFLGERVDWHLGFAAGGAALLAGTACFHAGRAHFGDVGETAPRPVPRAVLRTVGTRTGWVTAGIAVLVAATALTGVLTATRAIIVLGLAILVVPVLCLVKALGGAATADRRGLRGLLWLFLGSALFWMLVSQTGSVLNLFAQRSTDRELFGTTIPAGWLQSVTPLFMLVLAPVLAWWLGRAGSRVGVAVKFAAGLACAGTSFLLMGAAATQAAGGVKVSVLWLIAVYFLHACGELISAAVGISATAGAVSTEVVGQTIGLWWAFNALGAGFGSQVVRLTDVLGPTAYFLVLGGITVAAGALFVLRRRRIDGLVGATSVRSATREAAPR